MYYMYERTGVSTVIATQSLTLAPPIAPFMRFDSLAVLDQVR